jgi:acyl carrier protein
MEEAILRFVREQFKASIGTTTLQPDTPLFSTGIVDSFGVLELIAFLEDTFHVEINPARHELEEFDTAAKIAALVGRLSPKAP